MSNQAYIIKTTFNDHEGESYGYRIYDNYENDYCNLMQAEHLELDDKDFIHQIIRGGHASESFKSIMNHVYEMARGIYVDDSFFDWEDIADIMEWEV